jgi:uncharacterized RDD family membrane protein YckC
MTPQTFCPNCGAALAAAAGSCESCGAHVIRAAARSTGLAVEYAGFWMRFLSAIIDTIILSIIGFAVGLIATGTGVRLILGILIGITYTTGFWVATDGATPGKMAMGIKVQMANGDPIDVGPALLRYAGYYVSAIVLLLGYIMIAFNPTKRGLHDYIAGTVVIRTRF